MFSCIGNQIRPKMTIQMPSKSEFLGTFLVYKLGLENLHHHKVYEGLNYNYSMQNVYSTGLASQSYFFP